MDIKELISGFESNDSKAEYVFTVAENKGSNEVGIASDEVRKIVSNLTLDEHKILIRLQYALDKAPNLYSINDIRKIFGDEIAEELIGFQKTNKENYKEYIQRISKNPSFRKIKIAELEVLLDSLGDIDDRQSLKKTMKYRKALEFLKRC